MNALPETVSPIVIVATAIIVAAAIIVRAASIVVIIAAVLLSCIHRAMDPKDKSHDQTSKHQSSNNGGNIQVGSNHSLLFGLINGST